MGSLIARVGEKLGDAVIDQHEALGDATILVERERITQVMALLRDDPDLRFNVLIDLTVVDYLGRSPRFELVYHLASIDVEPHGTDPCGLRERLRVKSAVPEQPCEIDSLTPLWPAADWMEREAFDLYGVHFKGHPDLRRILLNEEFVGHPLRKDYPKERRQPLVGPKN